MPGRIVRITAVRRSLARLLALAVLCAQTFPAPMMAEAEAVPGLYAVTDICSTRTGMPAGAPNSKCDLCCWGQASHSMAGLLPQEMLLIRPGAWNRRLSISPVEGQSDRRILDAAQPRGPPIA